MKQFLNPKLLQDTFMKIVWGNSDTRPGDDRPGIITSLRISHLIIRDLIDGMITLRAMGLVYTTILALVPLLAVSFSVLKGFGVHNQIEPLLLNFLMPLGDKGAEISNQIIGFVENTKAGVLGSLGLALLLYTVISLLQKIEQSFNYTWRVSHHRSVGKRFSNYLTVVMIGPVLLFSALGVTASIASVSVVQDAMQVESIGFLTKLMGRMVPYLLILCAFTFIYMFVPNTRVKFKSAFIGAAVSAALWETSSWAFASFVVGSSKYTAIYSAFASMIIFFIWIYISWLILLIGCSIVFYHQNPAQQSLDSHKINLSNREREAIALNIMALVAKHYRANKETWTIESLAIQMKISAEAVSMVIHQLLDQKLLIETTDTPTSFLPAYDIERMSLHDIMFSIRCSNESRSHSLESIKTENKVRQLHSDIEESVAQLLKDKSLKDLSG